MSIVGYDIKMKFSNNLTLFLIYPFLAFIKSVRYIHIREHFWIVLLFALFFCYTFIPIPGSDATRYEERQVSLGDYTFYEYISDVKNMYSLESRFPDLYVYTVQFIASKFTSDIRGFRLLFGLIYYFTFLSLIRYLRLNLSANEYRFNWFLIGIVYIIPLSSGLNGIRWPLALMVYLLGSYQYIKSKELKYALLASISIFVHFIFVYSVLFLFFFILTKKFYNPKFASLIVFLGFVLSNLLLSGVKDNLSLLGERVEDKAVSYTENDNWKEHRLNQDAKQHWYVKFKKTAPSSFTLAALLITTYFGVALRKSKFTRDLQYFALLCFLAAFISSQILVAADNRFMFNALGIGLIYLYHLYNENQESKMLKYIKNIYLPILVITILVVMRIDLYTVSPNLLFGNIFIEMYYRFDEGIQDLIGI
jgi:hypothetical protein